MIQYLPIILICANIIPTAECRKDNREITSVTVGELQNTPMSCIMNGQVKMASTSLVSDDKYYVKIVCEPKR